jgi:hypothetical protein
MRHRHSDLSAGSAVRYFNFDIHSYASPYIDVYPHYTSHLNFHAHCNVDLNTFPYLDFFSSDLHPDLSAGSAVRYFNFDIDSSTDRHLNGHQHCNPHLQRRSMRH